MRIRALILVFGALTFCVGALTAQQSATSAATTPKWVATDGPIGGLGYDIRYNFADTKLWYVTDSYSGMNISSDGGKTWKRSITGITTRHPGDAIPVFCLTVDPNDPTIVWLGTSESGDIYRSTDSGHTWTKKINGTDRTRAIWVSFRGFTVEPGNSNVVYAMAEIASPGYTADGSREICFGPDKTKGVVYKTTDGGENWTQIWHGDNLARYCFIDPRDHNVLYVSTGIFDREPANCTVSPLAPGGVGILKSTDGGKTWSVLDGSNGLTDLHIGSLYMNPQYPDVLLAAASNPDWIARSSADTAGVFLTENGGQTWKQVLKGEAFSTVEFCTANPEVAYAASPKAVYRSDDRGKTWQRFDREDGIWGPDGIIPGPPIDMQCDPSDTNRIFINNYLGGNFLSTDGGKTWVSSSQGYTGAQMSFVAVSRKNSKVVFGGSRTGVFRNDNAGMGEWTGMSRVITPSDRPAVYLNEVTGMAVDPADDNHLIASPLDLGGIAYTEDGGKTWNVAEVHIIDAIVGSVRFAAGSSTRAYFGVTSNKCMGDNPQCDGEKLGVWTSNDGGESWSQITNPAVRGHSVIQITTDPSKTGTLYVSMPGRGLWISTDGGTSWSDRSSGLPSTATVTALAIDPSSPERIFAGLDQGGTYRSTNAGVSWEHTNSGIDPEAMIVAIVVDPTSSDVIYAGESARGVYRSTDGGDTWSLFNEGLINRAIRGLAISADGSRMYAATNGAGVSRIDLNTPGRRRVCCK